MRSATLHAPGGITDAHIVAELPFLRHRAWRLTHNDADADDLCQETALRACAAKGRFRDGPGRHLRLWLAAIMNNFRISDVRQRARRRTLVASDIECDVRGAADRRGRRDLTREEGMQHLDDVLFRAIRDLGPAHRSALLSVAWDGLSYQELADQDRCSVGTAMSRLHRARMCAGNAMGELYVGKRRDRNRSRSRSPSDVAAVFESSLRRPGDGWSEEVA